MGQYAMSERRLMKLARSTQRYQSRRAERDAALRARPQELAARRMRFGYRRLTAMLVREGEEVNHKRVWKVSCWDRPRAERRSRMAQEFCQTLCQPLNILLRMTTVFFVVCFFR